MCVPCRRHFEERGFSSESVGHLTSHGLRSVNIGACVERLRTSHWSQALLPNRTYFSMPCNCSVLHCPSRFSQVDEGVYFHRFPKDETLRRKWIEACGVQTLNTENARVCSLHFVTSDYQRHLKYELLGQPVPKNLTHLKEGAIPTLKLPAASIREFEY